MKIGHELKSLNNMVKRCVASIVIEEGAPTYMQGGIIMYLMGENGPHYQRDIEKHFNIRRSTATGILRNMERDGLIERTPDESDARLKTITLTEKGRLSMERFSSRIDELEAKLTRGISDAELEQFLSVLQKMKEKLSE